MFRKHKRMTILALSLMTTYLISRMSHIFVRMKVSLNLASPSFILEYSNKLN